MTYSNFDLCESVSGCDDFKVLGHTSLILDNSPTWKVPLDTVHEMYFRLYASPLSHSKNFQWFLKNALWIPSGYFIVKSTTETNCSYTFVLYCFFLSIKMGSNVNSVCLYLTTHKREQFKKKKTDVIHMKPFYLQDMLLFVFLTPNSCCQITPRWPPNV